MSKKEEITTEALASIQEESEKQERPDQKIVTSVSEKIRRRAHNLPDPKNPPLGYDDHKAFDRVFPYLNIPALHPQTETDKVVFNDLDSEPNRLYLGDNLEVLRTLKSESIDLIYIDPPFFSGRNYNVIWGDSNEVRTFQDIWEGGITSYLIWLNARLWEMRRVLKRSGVIYVHCDWHASHYIKTEMDKIFGYENFLAEIVWRYRRWPAKTPNFQRMHDVILHYAKSAGENTYNQQYEALAASTLSTFGTKRQLADFTSGHRKPSVTDIETEGAPMSDVWEIGVLAPISKERIGYPTQKPEALLERVILASTNEGDVVADFFLGGGTTVATAQRLNRRFIGCDSSRVAVSVTLNRLVKIGESLSGVESNISAKENFQMGMQTEGISQQVPSIQLSYLGVYPVEKFRGLDQEDFIQFVLTAYGASRNSGEGVTHGFKPPAQQEPLYVGPADPDRSVGADEVKAFFEEIVSKLEPNKMIRAKVLGWRFSRQVTEYMKVLRRYAEKNNLPIELEALPLDSREFRRRVLQRMPEVDEAELFLRFSKPPAIGGIRIRSTGVREYEFLAEDALSTNEDGWLVNAQWDFDYHEGHFAADRGYVLAREKKRDPKRGEIFEAVLSAKHRFEKPGKYIVACKVQDNLAGETIAQVRLEVT